MNMRSLSRRLPLWMLFLQATTFVPACQQDPDKPGTESPSPMDRVNPIIGSGGLYWGVGSGFLGASLPFGMAKPGPDTRGELGAFHIHHCSGYHYDDPIIEGFSQVHIHGTGAPDYGALLLMPTTGFDQNKTSQAGYRSSFSKDNEHAEPGYYSVVLDDVDVRVELTASLHSACHRYTWKTATDDAWVVIDPSHAIPSCEVSASSVELDPASGEVSGWLQYHGNLTGRSGGFRLFFSIVFNQAVERARFWETGGLLPDQTSKAEGEHVGVAVHLSAVTPVEVQIGLSYVDLAGARKNRTEETGRLDFDQLRQQAKAAWSLELEKVRIWGGTFDQQVIFYSALYHSFLHPTLTSDVDGRYTGFDKQIHQATGFDYYTDFSLWDTYRTIHPLFNLIQRDRQRDMIVSLLKMSEQDGILPLWPAGTGDGASMVGRPAEIVIAESVLKGIRDFDLDQALDAIQTEASMTLPQKGRDGVERYLELGFVPADEFSKATSKTLEYAIADAAVASMAAAIDKPEISAVFTESSKSYRAVFDTETRFMRGRNADGAWVEETEGEFNPLDWAAPYFAEGTAWQYAWLVPQDPEGLIELFGGRSEFAEKLETFFSTPEPEDPLAEYLPPLYYWHGNEPDIHAAYLFNDAGRPDRAQHWARHIMATRYGTGADGLSGNDDLGTLSAWYLFSAAGFFPVAGQERYWIGSPLFSRIVFRIDDNTTFEVIAKHASPENEFVQSARLGDTTLENAWFFHSDIASGGRLELDMGPQPTDWP